MICVNLCRMLTSARLLSGFTASLPILLGKPAQLKEKSFRGERALLAGSSGSWVRTLIRFSVARRDTGDVLRVTLAHPVLSAGSLTIVRLAPGVSHGASC